MAVIKGVIGAGHGGGGSTPGKRDPLGFYEWNYNDMVVDGFIAESKNYKGIKILRVDDDNASDGYQDVSLEERVRKANAWGADFYISVHQNANTGKWGSWGGTETYYYVGSQKSLDIAQVVHKAALNVLGLRDRGLKDGRWLYILRHTNMPAVLIECGFMDSTTDHSKLRNKTLMDRLGREIFRAIAGFYNLKRKEVGLTMDQYNELKNLIAGLKKENEELRAQLMDKLDKPSNYDAKNPTWGQEIWDEVAHTEKYFDGTRPHQFISRIEMAVVTKRITDNIAKWHVDPLKERVKALEGRLEVPGDQEPRE